MGFAACNDDAVALWRFLWRLLQVLGQAAGVAALWPGWWAQAFVQAFMHTAEEQLGQGGVAQRAHIGHIGAQLVRVLFGAKHRHAHDFGNAGQGGSVLHDLCTFKNDRHEFFLVVHQDELGFFEIKQHG